MATFNSVVLVGNLTRDVELRYTPNQKAVADLGLAVSRKFGDNEEVCFVDVTVWDKLAERCSEYLAKGRPVMVSGRLVQDTWEQDGVKRSKIKVVAQDVQFLGTPNKSPAKIEEVAEPTTDVGIHGIPF